jgi:hypothetical protein
MNKITGPLQVFSLFLSPFRDPRIRQRIQIGMFRPIRVDHTNCLQVDIKTHSFIESPALGSQWPPSWVGIRDDDDWVWWKAHAHAYLEEYRFHQSYPVSFSRWSLPHNSVWDQNLVQRQSAELPAYEWIVYKLSLFLCSVGHRVKTHKITPPPDNERVEAWHGDKGLCHLVTRRRR